MSNWREQLSEESETKAVAAWLHEYFHYPVLVVLIVFAFWNRIRNWSNFVVDGTVFFGGNDPWYHLRSTEYVVENNLATMPFDPWTYFPNGTANSQFGTLFDQIIGFVALVVGLGNPSESLVRHIFLVAPAFFGIASVIPAYFIGRRLGGRFGGVVAIGFIAFSPDRFLQVSVAGSTQHEVAEPLLMSLGILGTMVALTVAEREKPVWELITAGNLETLRGTIGWSMLAGVAMGLYMWTWPPGVWLMGILGVFYVIHLSLQHARGKSPEHAAFVGTVSLLTAGIMQLSAVRTFDITATARSILHPSLAFVIAGGVVFLAWLSREVERRDLSRYAYPGIVFGLIVTVAGLTAFILPDLFSFFYSQVDRVLGFITSPGTAAGTIGEAQPPQERLGYLYDRYQFATVTAALGALIILVRQTMPERAEGQQLLIVVWAAFMIAATWTQVRFGYYLTIPVGALNAVLIGLIVKTLGSATDREFSIEPYQVMTVAAVVLLMFVPLLGVPMVGADVTAADQADGQSRAGAVVAWNGGLEWMSENTPQEGQYANPDGEPMELFGTFDRTDNYEYPDGSYGVLSWWDYGHWITTQAERIPNANPFQQGASDAPYFLLAQSEDEALDELEQRFDESENAQTRYVMIDWKMTETETLRPFINGKFFAPVQFHDNFSQGDFYQPLYLTSPDQLGSRQELFTQRIMAHNQPYYESMVTRLYHYHGSYRNPSPIGVQRGGLSQGDRPVQSFENVSAAREWASQRADRSVGGVGVLPQESVGALEHFRLVHMNDVSAVPSRNLSEREQNLRDAGLRFSQALRVNRDSQITGLAPRALVGNNPAWTKTFERVPGATVEGTGPANSELLLAVQLEPENGEPFSYQQRIETDASGEFNTTVPYATEGYDEWGVEEGYTETNVRANGNYTIQSASSAATFDVSEGQVIGEDDSVVEVSLGAGTPTAQPDDEPNDTGETNDTESTDEQQSIRTQPVAP